MLIMYNTRQSLTLYQTTILRTGPNSKHLQMTNVAEVMVSVTCRVESIVGKGEYAGYQYFLLFSPCFHKASCSELFKVEIVW